MSKQKSLNFIKACENGDINKAYNLLKSKIDINVEVENDMGIMVNCIAVAVEHNQKEMLKFLIAQKADVDYQDDRGFSPLMVVEDTDIAKILIEAKADVNLTNVDNATALSNSTGLGYVKITQLLLEAKANPNIIGTEIYEFPLAISSFRNYTEIVNKLLEFKADVNLQDSNGNTALMLNAQKIPDKNFGKEDFMYSKSGFEGGNLKIIKKLIAAKADMNMQNNEGKTVFDIADPEIFAYMKNLHVSEMTKLVSDNGEERRVIPFPIAGGHHLLFKMVADYLFDN